MPSVRARRGISRAASVLPLLALGVGACRALLGIDDPGPPPDAPVSDASTQDAPSNDGGPDGQLDATPGDAGDPCFGRGRAVIYERFDVPPKYEVGPPGLDGGVFQQDGGVQISVGETGFAGEAYVKFTLPPNTQAPPGDWQTGSLGLDLLIKTLGASAPPVSDTLIRVRSATSAKELRLVRATDDAGPKYLLEPGLDPLPTLPVGEPFRLELRFPMIAADSGAKGAYRISMPDGGELTAEVSPDFRFGGDSVRLEVSIGSIKQGPQGAPLLKYTIDNVVLCLQ
jgi:hypothetical protein